MKGNEIQPTKGIYAVSTEQSLSNSTKDTEHFSHTNPTKQKRSALVFSASIHPLNEIPRKCEELSSPAGRWSSSCQTLFTQFLGDKVPRGWLQSAGKHWIRGHFLSDQDEYQPLALAQPLAFALVKLWCL